MEMVKRVTNRWKDGCRTKGDQNKPFELSGKKITLTLGF